MKTIYYLKPLAFFCLSFLFIFNSLAQADCLPPSRTTEISGNNIRTALSNNGTLFHRGGGIAGFTVPKNSGKTTIFSSTIWLGGLDEQDSLHVAAMLFNQNGNDFWTGPISDAGAPTGARYDRFWGVSKEQIEYHKLHYADSGYEMPESIATWPAHGRAQDGESWNLAPYKAVNGSGRYTPELGDYPEIRGDYAVYFIMNDRCGRHSESGGTAFGIEILCMVYAYDSPDSALYNTLFLSYVVRNKSAKNYKDFYFGFWTDFDIGYAYDDYVGCDTLLNLAYGYNGYEIDGSGQSWAYGAIPPAQGTMFLNHKMNAFVYHNNDNSPFGNPNTAIHYYNYARAIWKDGTPMTYGGNGYNPGSTDYTNFMFSGDPATQTGWTEVSEGNVPNDRRGLMSAGPLTLPAGKSLCFDMALPFARDYEGNHLTSVTLLKQRAQAIQQFYDNQNFENNCSINVGIKENKIHNNQLLIYPNPSNGQFTVTSEKIIESIELYDVLGKKVFSNTPKVQTTQINTGLPKGLYIYRAILQDNTMRSGKIIVQ